MVGQRGFSLIEVLVSVFIIGMLGVLSGAVIKAAPLSRHVKYENAALTIAANEIERLRSGGYEALPASGPFTNTLLADIPDAAGTLAIDDFNQDTKRVTATVSWRESNSSATSTVSLTTLITEVGGLP